MADELNIPTHRWYQKRNHIALAKEDFSRQYIYDSGIQKIDAWINSQPWGNPIPYLFANDEQGAWYDPSDLTTLFQDTAGTTPVTTAGQTVARMDDKSGNGNHATQPTAAARPTYQTDGTYRWLSFDGVDDTMGTSAFIQTGGGFYAAHGFNVLSEGGNAAAGDSFGSLRNVDRESVGWRSSGTYQYGSRLRVSGGVSYITSFTITGGTGSFGNNYVGDGWHDGLTLNARLSNGQSSSLAAEEIATGTPQMLTLANDSNYRFFGGIFRDGPPPPSDTRDQVQQYLADKTGVTL